MSAHLELKWDCGASVIELGSQQGLIQHSGGMRMDAIKLDQNETETTETRESTESSPYQQICPRHGEKVHLYHGCPKCVIEEVHRHERRIGAMFECDLPIPADSIEKANEMLSETSFGGTPE